MRIHTHGATTLLALTLMTGAGCTTGTPTPQLSSTGQATPPPLHRVPSLGAQAPMPFMAGSGAYAYKGPLAPGSGTFTNAVVSDLSANDPPATGGGSLSVTVGGTSYQSAALQSLAATFSDGSGPEYLLIGGFDVTPDARGTDIAQVLYVIVPSSDFAPGKTVALDGVDRVALFATGPADAPDPALVAVAETGSVTFTAGALTLGSTVSATVSGSFGEIDWVRDGADGGTGGTGSGASLPAGGYTMTIAGPARASCDGSLAGHEGDYAGLSPATAGFTDGSVTIGSASATSATLSGAPITTIFGQSSITLDGAGAGSPDGTFSFFGDATGAGPAGTQTSRVGLGLLLDASSASPTDVRGIAVAGYATSDGAGSCSVAFALMLSAP